MNLSSATLGVKVFWNHAEYLGGVFVAPLMPLLALRITGCCQDLRRLAVIVCTIPVMGLVLNWTSAWHTLFYTRIWLEPWGDLILLSKVRGPFYWILFLYNDVLIVAACVLLFRRLPQVRTFRPVQIRMLYLAFLAPLIINVPYLLQVPSLPRVNVTHIGFFLTAVTFSAALLGRQFMNVVAVARDEVIEQLPQALFVMDARKRIWDYNTRGAEFIRDHLVTPGGQAPHIRGQRADELSWNLQGLHELIQAATGKSGELTYGDRIYQAVVRDLPEACARRSGYYLLLDEMTSERRMVATLRQAEARNRLLLGHLNTLVFVITAEGLLTYVSSNLPDFFGQPAESLVGSSFKDVVMPEDLPGCAEFLRQVVQSGEMRSGSEYRVRHADGTIRWHTSSIMPAYDAERRAVTYVGVAHDITALKRAEEALRQANASQGRLIASREAELRVAVGSALHAAEGEAHRIGQEIHDGLCQELVALLRMAENAAARERPAGDAPPTAQLAAQVGHALRLARGISYDLTLHDLETQSLPDALDAFARRFGEVSGVAIETNCVSRLAAVQPAAADHIYRVVREAVVNAIHHAQAQRIWIDAVTEPQHIIVSITNDGAPLQTDAGQMARGIGLTQMHMRANQLGGTFELKRDEQGKTVAELIIPRNRLILAHGEGQT